MNILIIEDYYYFVKMLLNALTSKNTVGEEDDIQITTTSTAENALVLLKQRWDWILIDHDLPHHWSGWMLLNNTRQYRKKDQANIIAISAIPENNKRLMQHGAHFQVEKMNKNFIKDIMKIINKKVENN